VRTRAFLVLAKKAKAGTPAKVRVAPEVVEVDAARAAVLARMVVPAAPAPFLCAPGVRAGAAAVVVLPVPAVEPVLPAELPGCVGRGSAAPAPVVGVRSARKRAAEAAAEEEEATEAAVECHPAVGGGKQARWEVEEVSPFAPEVVAVPQRPSPLTPPTDLLTQVHVADGVFGDGVFGEGDAALWGAWASPGPWMAGFGGVLEDALSPLPVGECLALDADAAAAFQ